MNAAASDVPPPAFAGSIDDASWPALRQPQPLTPGAVDVYRVCFSQCGLTPAQLAHWLTAEEQQRFAGVRHGQRRQAQTFGRAVLRRLLGALTGQAPSAVELATAPGGKPHLLTQAPAFNLSHSGDLLLLAVAAGGRLGVDVEQVRQRAHWERLVERFFAPQEAAALRDLPTAQQLAAFHCVWTRKEALLKAEGSGIMLGLEHFAVTVAPDRPARLLSATGPAAGLAAFHLHDLPAPSAHSRAAVAWDQPITQVRCAHLLLG